MKEAIRIRQLLVRGVADLLDTNKIGKDPLNLKRVIVGLTIMTIHSARRAQIALPDYLALVEHHWLAIEAEYQEKKALN